MSQTCERLQLVQRLAGGLGGDAGGGHVEVGGDAGRDRARPGLLGLVCGCGHQCGHGCGW